MNGINCLGEMGGNIDEVHLGVTVSGNTLGVVSWNYIGVGKKNTKTIKLIRQGQFLYSSVLVVV